MDFWKAQASARSKTKYYLAAFVLITLFTAVVAEEAMRYFAPDVYDAPYPLIAILFLSITFIVAGYNYTMYQSFGGAYVAQSVGASEVHPLTTDPQEKVLLNIVKEMALASNLPVPRVFIIPAKQINAFAAGLSPGTAAIAVTEGAIERLSRDELQGVVAHEFGHIYNGDMLISLRLAAMVMGFFFVMYLGFRTLQLASYRRRDSREKGGNPVLLAAVVLLVAGIFTWFAGTLLKCVVSREREYLADACSVQFTRNPRGIASALRKIAGESVNDMPKAGMAFSHMYFDEHLGFSSLFATHPPIWKRIKAIEGNLYAPDHPLN